MRRTLAPSLLLGLAGCAGLPGSYVSPDIAAADAPALAQGIAGFVLLRGAPSAIVVDAPDGDRVLAPQVEAALREAGIVVAPGGRTRLAYQVEPRGDGALLRLSLDGARGARAYGRAPSGGLAPIGPYSVVLAEAGR